MSEANTDLLPCPFCGSKAVLKDTPMGWVVQCKDRFNLQRLCPINGRTRKGLTAEQAVTNWQTRHTQEALNTAASKEEVTA